MKYLLVVGFACDVYRQEPRARIYVNDQLIDEFHISYTTDNLYKASLFLNKNTHILQPYSYIEHTNLIIKNLPPLRFYEVDIDKKIKHLTMRINVDNSDSNYTNGFMTKSTLIKLKICYFFPMEKTVLWGLKEILKKNRISKNYSWYRTAKNNIFNLALNGINWKGSNRQFSNIPGWLLSQTTIGGNGNYICQLIKKYGIFMTTLARTCRYSIDWDIISFFIDKYQQHANQRNNN